MELKTQFNLRLSPEQFNRIKKAAKESGQSMNAYILSRCTESAQIKPVQPETVTALHKQEKPVKQAAKQWKPYGKQDAVK